MKLMALGSRCKHKKMALYSFRGGEGSYFLLLEITGFLFVVIFMTFSFYVCVAALHLCMF